MRTLKQPDGCCVTRVFAMPPNYFFFIICLRQS